MKRFSPSGQHYPDPSKPPENGTEEINNDDINDGSKKVKTTQSFESLFDNETLSDVILNVNDGQFVFNGHKMILGMKSDILASLLNELDSSDDKPILCLHESTECSLVFSRFLYFIYSGAVWLHRDYVIQLHKLAEKYAVKALVHHCQSYITQILHNMLGVYENIRGFPIEVVCDLYECNAFPEDIRTMSFKVLCAKFKELVTSDRWQQCPYQLVCDLLKNDNCNAEENVILTSATDWMKKNNLSDKTIIEDILVNIRYPLLHRRVLYHLKKNGAFKNFPQVQELVNNASHYHCFKDLPEAKDDFVGLQYMPRNFSSTIPSRSQSTEQIASIARLQSNVIINHATQPQSNHNHLDHNVLNRSVLVQNSGPVSFVHELNPSSQLVQSVRPNIIPSADSGTSAASTVVPSSASHINSNISSLRQSAETINGVQTVTTSTLLQNLVSSNFINGGPHGGSEHQSGYR